MYLLTVRDYEEASEITLVVDITQTDLARYAQKVALKLCNQFYKDLKYDDENHGTNDAPKYLEQLKPINEKIDGSNSGRMFRLCQEMTLGWVVMKIQKVSYGRPVVERL
jgi:hypothetical protein